MSVVSATGDCTKHMGTNLDCIVVGASSGAGFCLLPSDKDYCTGHLCIKLECVPCFCIKYGILVGAPDLGTTFLANLCSYLVAYMLT